MQCPHCSSEISTGATRCMHCGGQIGEPVVSTPAVRSAQSNFGDQFNAALIIWKMNLADLAVLSLVLLLLIWIPILNIGFMAGYARALLKVMRGEGRAEIADLFNAWDCFANLLVYVIIFAIGMGILNLIPVLGQIASPALGFLAFPGFYLIIDRKAGFAEALKWGIAKIQAQPGDWLLSYAVGIGFCGLGTLVLFIGIVLTMPLGMLVCHQQYENHKAD